jgi:hypothetical protein
MTSENGPLATVARYFRVNKRDLVYLKFILEAYEGLSTLSTAAREGMVVRVSYPQCFSRDIDLLLRALGEEISLTEVPEPAEDGASPLVAPRRKGENHAG